MVWHCWAWRIVAYRSQHVTDYSAYRTPPTRGKNGICRSTVTLKVPTVLWYSFNSTPLYTWRWGTMTVAVTSHAPFRLLLSRYLRRPKNGWLPCIIYSGSSMEVCIFSLSTCLVHCPATKTITPDSKTNRAIFWLSSSYLRICSDAKLIYVTPHSGNIL